MPYLAMLASEGRMWPLPAEESKWMKKLQGPAINTCQLDSGMAV